MAHGGKARREARATPSRAVAVSRPDGAPPFGASFRYPYMLTAALRIGKELEWGTATTLIFPPRGLRGDAAALWQALSGLKPGGHRAILAGRAE